ncbi:MAG: phosphoglycerate kinase [Patescibacteria group bacterium]|nr:phosphoglycerate kinase [Patescibacteria group bacterium]
MTIKSIRQIRIKNLSGRKVFLRVDFNIPIENGKIKDDYKIIACLPTIRFLLRHRCKVIIATHLGRPLSRNTQRATHNIKNFSIKPIAARLSKLLGKKVKFVDDCVGFKVGTEASKLKEGQILMLENLRFNKGEKNNSKKFAKELASLADIYINNAFAASHRNHASVSAIKKYLTSYAGILLEQELIHLNKILKPNKPLILVIGGVKIATKIKLIKKLYKRTSRILIGGALANIFFAAHKLEVGKSIVDKQSIKFAKNFKYKNIILPIDVIVSDKKDGTGKAIVKNVYTVKKNEIILDIGPQTVRLYNSFIKQAKTIIWNGPMGMFEQERFKYGTLSIARSVAARSTGHAFGLVGGGETAEALKMTKMFDYVDWVSTSGGAMLAYLAGDRMPGLTGLIK